MISLSLLIILSCHEQQLLNTISYLADHGEDLIGGWVHCQDNYSPPAKVHINGEGSQDDKTENKSSY